MNIKSRALVCLSSALILGLGTVSVGVAKDQDKIKIGKDQMSTQRFMPAGERGKLGDKYRLGEHRRSNAMVGAGPRGPLPLKEEDAKAVLEGQGVLKIPTQRGNPLPNANDTK